MKRLHVLAATSLALLAACADNPTAVVPSSTAEQPAYAVSAATPWTPTGPGTVTLVSDGTAGDAEMSYSLQGTAVFTLQTWDFETTTAQAGTVTLPWSYSGYHAFFMAQVVLQAVVNNAVVATLVSGPSSGGFSFSGNQTFTLNAGDTYGFRFGGRNFDSDSRLLGSFTVHYNADPVLAPIANQSVDEGSALGFTASATDADSGQALTYSLVGAPAGASIDPVTGVFSWTPVDDDPTGTPQDNYTFTVRVTDDAGASDEQPVTVTVHNVAPTVTSVSGPVGPIGIAGGSATANISVTFTDPGSGDTHTTSIDCGNSTSASGGTCTYTAAGVYTVTATVTDDDGGSDSGTYQYVVVYDPGAGFVTGGGWITSPAGAYAANPALTGRANFGFNSKYKQGANVPDGQTQFHFQAAGFNFHSTAYEWLVVAGARAQYKGTGTINGSGSYSFLLTVIDGQKPGGGGVDRFRLKVWGPGGVIYDNQVGDADDAPASTALGGGSIVIHN
jgi:hypothetical protein